MIPVWSPRSSWVGAGLVALLLIVVLVLALAGCAASVTPDNF